MHKHAYFNALQYYSASSLIHLPTEQTVMLRLLANRDSRRIPRDMDDVEDEEEDTRYDELDADSYYNVLRSKREEEAEARADLGGAARTDSSSSVRKYSSDDSLGSDEVVHYEDDDDEPQYQGWGAAGFSSDDDQRSGRSAYSRADTRRQGGAVATSADGSGRSRRKMQWERVSGRPKPRARRAKAVRGGDRDRQGSSPLRSVGSKREEGTYGSEARLRWREKGSRISDVAGGDRDGRRS